MTVVALKACPRCGGDILENYGDRQCVQCSYAGPTMRAEDLEAGYGGNPLGFISRPETRTWHFTMSVFNGEPFTITVEWFKDRKRAYCERILGWPYDQAYVSPHRDYAYKDQAKSRHNEIGRHWIHQITAAFHAEHGVQLNWVRAALYHGRQP